VLQCVVFVIECEGDKFLFVWGLGKGTIGEDWKQGPRDQEPDARDQRPDAKGQRRVARTRDQRQGPKARGMEDQGWGQGQGGQGARTRGQRPGTRVRGLKEQAGCVSCLNNWMTH
jgi:hypothetical protein